ncbi:MAG: type I CRISPR-associated protein Cas7, partial [Candidatus Methanogasteraceae archaeon]
MNSTIANRSELVFLYDLKDANPNGDPLDENKPRIDEETGINLVTDVRLKRTIRDYLYKFKKQEIFVREIETGEGHIQDAKLRAEDFLV